MKGLYLHEEDFNLADRIYQEERISPLTSENMFLRAIYCILSAAEHFSKQKLVYEGLINAGLTTPEQIALHPGLLSDIVSKARYPNSKERAIAGLAQWWPETDLPARIIADVSDSQQKEFELRNGLAKECPGMWYKCASLFMRMCGYRNVVPVDLWAMRFLRDKGFDIRIPSDQTSGLTKKEYMEYEQAFARVASEFGIPPAHFQLLLYAKFSTWKAANGTGEGAQLELLLGDGPIR
ncbi:MAG: hypothetical protein KJ574_02330 [Nanoarchaeota archaeon]|nr:hypothetical protein [Nanoarchaeota archaeon]